MKYNLGKTKDSRTRKRGVEAVNIQAVERLKEQLKNQEEFIDYLMLKGFSISTAKRYVVDVELFLSWLKKEKIQAENVSYSDVLHYIQGKRKEVKQRTISANINSIKHYFNFLAITDQQIENPTTHIKIKGIKRKHLYDILSKAELESLFKNFDIQDEKCKNKNQNWFKSSELVSKRNRVILGLMIYQGLGTTELGRLNEHDIKLREGKIFIAGTRKSNDRELKLESHQVMDIMEYTLSVRKELLKISNKESESFFVSTGSGSRFSSIMEKLMKKLRKQNSKVTSARQIRTSVITHWLKIHNLRQVQYMAGHRYVSSTESFLVNDIEDLQEDVAKYHPI